MKPKEKEGGEAPAKHGQVDMTKNGIQQVNKHVS